MGYIWCDNVENNCPKEHFISWKFMSPNRTIVQQKFSLVGGQMYLTWIEGLVLGGDTCLELMHISLLCHLEWINKFLWAWIFFLLKCWNWWTLKSLRQHFIMGRHLFSWCRIYIQKPAYFMCNSHSFSYLFSGLFLMLHLNL